MVGVRYDDIGASARSRHGAILETALIFPGKYGFVILNEAVHVVLHRVRGVDKYEIPRANIVQGGFEIRDLEVGNGK